MHHQHQQQQHLMQMQPMMAAYYPNTVTSDHIQQYLDENKSLILKIVESQNSGKLAECAENQARLQKNLMYLAAIADSQPQPPPMHSQFSTGGIMESGSPYMQQAHQIMPQSLMAARSNSMMYNSQLPYAALQQQHQALHSQLVKSLSGGVHVLQGEATSSAGTPSSSAGTPCSYSDFGRIESGGVTKHELWNGEASGGSPLAGDVKGMYMTNNGGPDDHGN